MTTNAVESWHSSLKTHAEGIIIPLILLRFYYKLTYILRKAAMQRFSPTGAANHVLQTNNVFRIGDQWEIRAQKAGIDFRTTRTPKYQDYLQLALFPYPVQSLLVE